MGVAEPREDGDVAPERRRVAADEDEARRSRRGETGGGPAAEPWARRVGDHDASGQWVPRCDLGAHHVHVRSEVVTCVPHRRAVPFDRHHLAPLTEQTSEQADTAVGVDEGAPLVLVDERLAHHRDENLGTVGPGLEERRRRDRERASADDLVDACGSTTLDLALSDHGDVVSDLDAVGCRGCEHEALPRRASTPQGDLPRIAIPSVAHEIGEQRMGDETRVDVDEVVAAVRSEAGASSSHSHAQRRAIALRRKPRRKSDVGAGKSADAAESVCNDAALQLDLHLGSDVLPSTSSAPRRDECAGRRDAGGRGLEDRHDGRLRVVDVLVVDLGVDELVGKRTIDEHDSTVLVTGERRATGGHRGGAQAKHGPSVRPGRATYRRDVHPIAIVPSVLPIDQGRLTEGVIELEKAGCDRVQFDVMDGQFVPVITFGADVIAAIRAEVSLPFEAHLMIDTPEQMLRPMHEAGCETLIVHAETTRHLHRTLGAVRDLGARAAVAINPATPASAVANVLDLVDHVLVMTVNPGWGGQKYISTMEPKIAEVALMIEASGYDVGIEVDGGIGPSTVAGAVGAGANLLVAGSAIFRDPEGLEHAVADLRARGVAAQQAASG